MFFFSNRFFNKSVFLLLPLFHHIFFIFFTCFTLFPCCKIQIKKPYTLLTSSFKQEFYARQAA